MANVTEAEMRAYLQTFHDEYTRTVETFVPPDHRPRLMRYSLLPVSMVGYVSTQLGAGYEYFGGDAEISTRRGSARIEDLFVDCPSWLSGVGPMFAIGGTGTGILKLTLEGGFPFRFVDQSADVFFYEVRFKAGTWERDVLYAHLFADRREERWSEAEAVRRAKDEVLAALFDLQQSAARSVDLGTYLRTFKERTVLVLGDFTHGRGRLTEIKEALAAAGYFGVLLDEVPEEPHYDLRQKFQAVAPVCRMLIFEDSMPSGHIAEMVLADPLHLPTIVLREGEEQSTFMTRGLGLTSRVVREWQYTPETLNTVLTEALAWAESVIGELAEERQNLYPWRAEEAEEH